MFIFNLAVLELTFNFEIYWKVWLVQQSVWNHRCWEFAKLVWPRDGFLLSAQNIPHISLLYITSIQIYPGKIYTKFQEFACFGKICFQLSKFKFFHAHILVYCNQRKIGLQKAFVMWSSVSFQYQWYISE